MTTRLAVAGRRGDSRIGNGGWAGPAVIMPIMRSEPAGAVSPFGARLRRWRRHRDISQLALATLAGSTSRHISFLETGLSRPSRQMVLRLGEALGVPLRERNRLRWWRDVLDTYRH